MSFEYARRLSAKCLGVLSMGANRSQSARQSDIRSDGPNMDQTGASSWNDPQPRRARRKAGYSSWMKAARARPFKYSRSSARVFCARNKLRAVPLYCSGLPAAGANSSVLSGIAKGRPWFPIASPPYGKLSASARAREKLGILEPLRTPEAVGHRAPSFDHLVGATE